MFLFSCKWKGINDSEKIILKDFSHCIFYNIIGECTIANAFELVFFVTLGALADIALLYFLGNKNKIVVFLTFLLRYVFSAVCEKSLSHLLF